MILCFFIVVVTAISLPGYSAEVYIWVDGKGIKHITDQPPEKPAKIIRKETYKKDSPEEIQRYQAEQKENEKRREAEIKADEQQREAELRQRQQINAAQEEADREKNQQKDQQKKGEELGQ